MHICHVSTKGGVQLLREAKARGVRVTAETCPHYFTLTDDVIVNYDANTKVNPPIREAEDVAAIKEGLRDGTLDCIVTDHAPHHRDEKNCEYNLAAFGISGIETSFSLSYTALVRGGVLTLEQLARRMSGAPRADPRVGRRLSARGRGGGSHARRSRRKICDRPEGFPLQRDEYPVCGKEVYGRVKYTIVDGNIKYRAE